MNKTTALFFYGHDGNAAKALAASHRKTEGPAYVRHADAFVASEPAEACDIVYTLPCVTDPSRIVAVYGDKVRTADVGAPAAPPPPAPPPGDALAGLAADWQQTAATKELKPIAAAISGRAVDNRAQAVQVIEAEIARRALPPPPV